MIKPCLNGLVLNLELTDDDLVIDEYHARCALTC